MTRRHLARHRCGQARDRRATRSTSSATASAARCCGTTLAYLAARGDEPFASATFFAAQVDFTKAGDLMLFIDDAQLKALEEMMAERGYLDGSRMATVFNMLRAEGPDLALHRQQLHAGQEAVPVRSAVLEPGLDADAGGQPQLLPARILSREQAGARADVDRRRQARSRQGQAADLRAVRQGRPHRAGQVGVHRLAAVRRPGHLRAGRAPATSPASSIRRPEQVSVLDQRQEGRDAGSLARGRRGASGLLVAALCRLAGQAFGRHR